MAKLLFAVVFIVPVFADVLQPYNETDKFIMVIGGVANFWATDYIELVSPYPERNPVPECLQTLRRFPYGKIRD